VRSKKKTIKVEENCGKFLKNVSQIVGDVEMLKTDFESKLKSETSEVFSGFYSEANKAFEQLASVKVFRFEQIKMTAKPRSTVKHTNSTTTTSSD
jgi:hypothetical protein